MHCKFSVRPYLLMSYVLVIILSVYIINENHVYVQVRNDNTGIFLKG